MIAYDEVENHGKLWLFLVSKELQEEGHIMLLSWAVHNVFCVCIEVALTGLFISGCSCQVSLQQDMQPKVQSTHLRTQGQ